MTDFQNYKKIKLKNWKYKDEHDGRGHTFPQAIYAAKLSNFVIKQYILLLF